MKKGPIIVVEDDMDDQEIMTSVVADLGYQNKLIFFHEAASAYEYLATTREAPFVILCDINMPKQNGLSFKKQLDENPVLRKKSIPFVFYSTSVDQETIDLAYEKFTIQGFFKKRNDYKEIKKMIGSILEYWTWCSHPNVNDWDQ